MMYVLFGLLGFSWVALLSLGFLRSHLALVPAFDTGLYIDLLQSLLSGQGWQSHLLGEPQFLAHHFQPLVLGLLPVAWISNTPASLFAVSATIMAATMWLCWKLLRHVNDLNLLTMALTVLCLSHSTFSARMFHSFTPEILVTPALFWAAFHLEQPGNKPWWQWALALSFIGCAKENYWLIASWMAFVLACKIKSYLFAGMAVLYLIIFAALMLWWMPNHTAIESYYGTGFYLSTPTLAPLDIASELAMNLFSMQSGVSLAAAILLTGGLAVLRPSWALFAAMPALMMILLAKASQIHHPANHYLIPVIPCFWAAAIHTTKVLRFSVKPAVSVAIASFNVAFTPLFPGGAIDQAKLALTFAANQRSLLEEISRVPLITDTTLLTNSTLQPILATKHQPTQVFLSYDGNPVRTSLAAKPTFQVLVTENLQNLDCHRAIPGGAHLQVDQQYFVDLCKYIQEHSKTALSFKGLHYFHVGPP